MRVKVYVIDFAVPARVKAWALGALAPTIVLLAAAVAFAAPVTFSDGQILKAADLNTNFGYLVPSGAVVAFNLAACPVGWGPVAAAQGRTIIGVNPSGANGLSTRILNETVGEETHTMQLSELVPHTHGEIVSNTNGYTGADGQAGGNGYLGTNHGVVATASAGGGAPFNNMQPSLALLYCQKD
jgi:hypothetical protein